MTEKKWKHPLYGRWKSMHASVYNSHTDAWRNVEGATVPEVCERWRGVSCEDPGFANFIEDVGVPEVLNINVCLRRLDLRKDWSPDNVEWSTKKDVYKLNQCRALGWANWLPEKRAKAIQDELDRRHVEEAVELAASVKI